MTLTRRSCLAALIVLALAACREAAPLPPERAIVILISIDGFRWDYPELHGAPALGPHREDVPQALALQGEQPLHELQRGVPAPRDVKALRHVEQGESDARVLWPQVLFPQRRRGHGRTLRASPSRRAAGRHGRRCRNVGA
jgi:hypothetical protein